MCKLIMENSMTITSIFFPKHKANIRYIFVRLSFYKSSFLTRFFIQVLNTLLPFGFNRGQIYNLPIRVHLQSNFLIFLQPFHETNYKSMLYRREILYQSLAQSKNMYSKKWSVFPSNPCLNYIRIYLKLFKRKS